jgi:hypothetical protein
MEETLCQPRAIRGMGTPFKPTFKLFIACESQAAFFQAKKVENQIGALYGGEINISRVFWSFSLLRYQQLRNHAAMEAAEAQMIIISIEGNNELPPQVKCLLGNLPSRTQAGQAALVTLIGPERSLLKRTAQHPDLAYLRQIAESRGLDFFCNQEGWEHLDFPPSAFRPRETTGVPESIISYYIPWSTGTSMNRLKKQTQN